MDEDYDVDEEYDNDYADNYFDNGEGDDLDDLGGGGGDPSGGGAFRVFHAFLECQRSFSDRIRLRLDGISIPIVYCLSIPYHSISSMFVFLWCRNSRVSAYQCQVPTVLVLAV